MMKLPPWLSQVLMWGTPALVIIWLGTRLRAAYVDNQENKNNAVSVKTSPGVNSSQGARFGYSQGALPGCPGPLKNAFDLAKADGSLLSFSEVIVADTRGITCPPCNLRARFRDGTKLILTGALVQRNFSKMARRDLRLNFCGRIVLRSAQESWVSVERMR